MTLRPWVRRRLWLRNLWPVPLWMTGGVLAAAYLPAYSEGTLAVFVAASALAVGTIFATHGLDRLRDQKNQISLQVAVSTVVGEELLANRMHLETLAQAGKKDEEGIPLHLLTGPLRLKGGDLARTHLFNLEWKQEFLARVMHLYHGLEEAEALRTLYVQSLAFGGPPSAWTSLAHTLRSTSKDLLEDLDEVKEAFDGQDYHRRDGILGRFWRLSKSRDDERPPTKVTL